MGKKLKEKKQKRAVKKTAPIKNNKSKDKQDDKFNFNDEIVIGISVPTNEKNAPKNKKKKNNKKTTNAKKKKNVKEKKTKQNVHIEQENKVKSTRMLSIIKILAIMLIIGAGIVFLLVSPEFNIDNINIIGNSHLDSQTILNLANIEKGTNILSFSKRKVISNIKENGYIENVHIKRNFPSTVDITVKERKATFNVSYENEYIYINNRGYILEVSDAKTDKPTIIGSSINKEDIKEGNTIPDEDLEKLQDILKILEICSNNDLTELITSINIAKKDDYILIMESEGKTIHVGDISNLATKILYAKNIIDSEKGINGEIFVDGDLNENGAIFRLSV